MIFTFDRNLTWFHIFSLIEPFEANLFLHLFDYGRVFDFWSSLFHWSNASEEYPFTVSWPLFPLIALRTRPDRFYRKSSYLQWAIMQQWHFTLIFFEAGGYHDRSQNLKMTKIAFTPLILTHWCNAIETYPPILKYILLRFIVTE